MRNEEQSKNTKLKNLEKENAEFEAAVNPKGRQVTGVVTETTNVGLFSLFLKQNLESMLFKLPLHVSIFPVLVTLSLIELVYKVREARMASAKKVDGWKGTVLVAVVATVGFLAAMAATVLSFLFTSILTPALFVGSIALGAVVQLGLGIYHVAKAIGNWNNKEQRNIYLKKAAANAVGFVLGGIAAVAIGMLMIVLAPAASKVWAGVGIGLSLAGLGFRVPWAKMRDKVKSWYNKTSLSSPAADLSAEHKPGEKPQPQPEAENTTTTAGKKSPSSTESGFGTEFSELSRDVSPATVSTDTTASMDSATSDKPVDDTKAPAVSRSGANVRWSPDIFASPAAGENPSADWQKNQGFGNSG